MRKSSSFRDTEIAAFDTEVRHYSRTDSNREYNVFVSNGLQSQSFVTRSSEPASNRSVSTQRPVQDSLFVLISQCTQRRRCLISFPRPQRSTSMRPSAAITRASRADIVLATDGVRRYRGLHAASGWLDNQLRELFEPVSPSDVESQRPFGRDSHLPYCLFAG